VSHTPGKFVQNAVIGFLDMDTGELRDSNLRWEEAKLRPRELLECIANSDEMRLVLGNTPVGRLIYREEDIMLEAPSVRVKIPHNAPPARPSNDGYVDAVEKLIAREKENDRRLSVNAACKAVIDETHANWTDENRKKKANSVYKSYKNQHPY
jgi:hypothetical protein